MGGIWRVSSNFTKGELDPLLVGRSDLEAYYQGVREATNVLSIPQGGLKKRSGMEFVEVGLGDGRLEPFSFSTEQNYLLAFTALKMQIYKDGVLQTNINGSGDDYLDVPWTIDEIRLFDFIQSADTIIITHAEVKPRRIVRNSDTEWAISDLPLSDIPQFDYDDGDSPTPVTEKQQINWAAQNQGDRYKISLNGVLTDEIVFGSTDEANRNDIKDALLALPNTGNSGISVNTITTLDTYEVVLSGDSANDWDTMQVTGVSTKSASFEAITTRTKTGTSRNEDVWSALRGWPRTCTFHEGRLWFGGSLSRPSTIWGSVVGDVFSFKKGKARDDELIDATLATDQVNAITGIISNRALQVFTTGAEFYVPASPITPATVSVKPQTNLGSKRVRPVTIGGVTLFLQRTGKGLYEFQFSNDLQSNEARPVSLLAPHLIKDPLQMAVSRGSSTTDASYVYLVSDDGDVSVFNTQSQEGVQSFTNWTTQGSIKSVAVVDDIAYFITEREIDGNTVYYVERDGLGLNTDSSVKSVVASDTLTGLDHLEGETVKVKADGAVQPDAVVVGGQITIGRVANEIEAGLEYQPRIETMPFSTQLKNGPNSAQKKRIMRCALQLFESNGVIVNGNFLADRTIGQDQFDAPIPQTELKRIFLSGWSLEASVVITQETPMPMTILAIDLEVKV